MPRKYTLKERKLGRERASGQVFFSEKLIEIDSRLPAREKQKTAIHEALHVAFPKAPEKEILRAERVVDQILWDYGLRLLQK